MPARRLFLSLLLIASLMIGSVAYGQADDDDDAPPHPLLAMMGRIPANNDTVVYMDYQAVWSVNAPGLRATRASDLRIPSLAEQWYNRSWRVTSGMLLMDASTDTMEAIPETLGFDFFDIHQVAQFGTIPEDGRVLSGRFDPDAVTEAYLNRGYEPVEISGVAALCHEGDCASGVNVNFQEREPGNLFDSGLGRKPPLLLLDDGALISTPAQSTLNRSARVVTGGLPSLLDSPDHKAIADALTDPELFPGSLLQVYFLPPDMLNVIDLRTAIDDEELAALMLGTLGVSENWQDYGSLPPYFRFAIADYEDSESQRAVIALVYTSTELAQVAAEEVARRLMTFAPADRPPFVEQIDGAQIDPPVIYETPDRVVALVTVRYPLHDELNWTLSSRSGGQMFLWWYRALLFNEFLPVLPLLLPDSE